MSASSRGLSDPVELRAIKVIGGGRTLAHADGATWMIQGGLPGELLRVQPTRRRAKIVEAEVSDVLADPHPARLDQVCPHAQDCGGCDWPHVDPHRGASLKNSVAAESAARFPDVADRLVDAPLMESAPGYRLRSRLHWDPESAALGFYGPKTWRVSPIARCRIISPTLARLLPRLTTILSARATERVDLEIIEGSNSMIAALRPARGGPKIIPRSWLPPAAECPELAGAHILTKSSRLLPGWGRDHVIIDLPVPLQVPMGSFFQGNRHLVPWLFDRVATLIGAGDEPVIDLHGGVGFLAAAAGWAGRKDLTVVERHPGSAAAAQRNLPHATVFAGSSEEFADRHENLPTGAVLMTDPPRSGLTPRLRRQISRWRPRRILMLGCDPATWSRDTADLQEHGYRLSHLELVDLFPFTHHVEILAVLESG